MAAKKNKFTPKQERFIAEYLIDLNATQAAIRAGFAENGARVTGHRLLTNPNIASAVAKAKAKQFIRSECNAQRILLELLRLSTADLKSCLDKHGRVKNIKDLPDDVTAAISSLTFKDGQIHSVRLWDKNAALTNLAKHFDLLKEHIVVHNDERKIEQEIEQLLEEASARAKDKDPGWA